MRIIAIVRSLFGTEKTTQPAEHARPADAKMERMMQAEDRRQARRLLAPSATSEARRREESARMQYLDPRTPGGIADF
jgi:hypothetical protein